jgi:hypothetical protein
LKRNSDVEIAYPYNDKNRSYSGKPKETDEEVEQINPVRQLSPSNLKT